MYLIIQDDTVNWSWDKGIRIWNLFISFYDLKKAMKD